MLAALIAAGGRHTPEGFPCLYQRPISTFGLAARFDTALAVLMASPGFISIIPGGGMGSSPKSERLAAL